MEKTIDFYPFFEFSFLSVILFVFLFNLIQYRQNRDTSHLFYALYLLVSFFYFLRKSPEFLGVFLGSDLVEKIKLFLFSKYYGFSVFSRTELTISMLLLITYCLFVQHFFNLRQLHPKLNQLVNYGYCLFIFLILTDWLLLAIVGKSKAFELIVKFLLLAPGLYFYYSTFKLKIQLYNYIVAGSIVMTLGTVVTGLLFIPGLAQSGAHPSGIFQTLLKHKYFTFELGVLFEILLFSAALAFKSYLNEKEKNEANIKLLEKERENNNLKIRQLELDDITLKAQMDTHFTFHCLGTIRYLMNNRGLDEVNGYLDIFSDLLRQVLERMRQSTHSLEEEFKIIALYLYLESMRFNGDFAYNIITDPRLDMTAIKLPGLSVQPFIENAIEHGLSLKKGKKRLMIQVQKCSTFIKVSIDDNGIGRKRSEEIRKSSPAYLRNSVAIGNVERRFWIHKQLSGIPIELDTIDKMKNQSPAGTCVEINIYEDLDDE